MKWGTDMEHLDKKALIAQYKLRKITGGVFSITNTATGKRHIDAGTDLQGLENRLNFAKMTNTPYSTALTKDWNEYGPQVFELEILETLEKKDSMTDKEFRQEVETLLDMWLEKESKEE